MDRSPSFPGSTVLITCSSYLQMYILGGMAAKNQVFRAVHNITPLPFTRIARPHKLKQEKSRMEVFLRRGLFYPSQKSTICHFRASRSRTTTLAT